MKKKNIKLEINIKRLEIEIENGKRILYIKECVLTVEKCRLNLKNNPNRRKVYTALLYDAIDELSYCPLPK